MKLYKKICIVILVKDNDLIQLENTINNLKKNNCELDEYVVAVREKSYGIIEYCKMNSISYLEYEDTEEVYYKLSKDIECDYISFINEGDEYSDGFKEILTNNIGEDTNNILLCAINEKEQKYILNGNLKKCKEVRIEETPKKIWVQLKSVFINKKLLEKIESPKEKLVYYIEQNLITKLISLNGGYKILKGINLTTRTNIRRLY